MRNRGFRPARSRLGVRAVAVSIAATLIVAPALAQTTVTPPKNKFTPEQDVQLGQQAAAEVRKVYPIITNDAIDGFVDRIGERLVAAAPANLNNPVFQYEFTPVNVKEINAFALPGGPMFINRGMIESAHTEGEVAGVMAHELAHVLLRHGTANATKAQKFQIGALAGAIAGAIVGGGVGQVISQGSQFGLGTWMLKYSREYEKQADILGVQMMARAGYDPRDLARVFENIEKQGGGGAPQWMSDHPNPGNRSAYIAREAEMVRVTNTRNDSAELQRAKQALASLPRAKSMADVERSASRGEGGGEAPASVGRVGDPVPAPSSSYRTVRGGNLFQASVPSNWQAVSSNNNVKFVPQNGLGDYNGQSVFTHGVEVGVARATSRDLNEATEALLDAFSQGNPNLKETRQPQVTQLAQRRAIAHLLENRSATGGREYVGLYTTFLSDGNVFYYLTVAPDEDVNRFTPAFQRIGNSIRLNDR
jgi:Zn-dependent protease with chaperone function